MPTFPKTRWLLVLCLPALLTPITHGQSPAKVTPQEAGLSSTALQQIDVLLQQAVERKQVAGAVALLARDGKLGYLRAKGFQDVEAGKEMTTGTLFRIASMSKPVTSVAVMILVDDGRLTCYRSGVEVSSRVQESAGVDAGIRRRFQTRSRQPGR